MDDVVYLNDLFDIYGDLLTERQRTYFKDYYFDNLSYGEISEKYNISRNASFKQLKNVIDKLNELEKNLGIYRKNKIIKEIIDMEKDQNIRNKLEKLL